MTSESRISNATDGSIAALQQLKEAEVGGEQRLKDRQAKSAQTLQQTRSETERLLQELKAELDRDRESQLRQARAEAESASAKILSEGQAAATKESDAASDLSGPIGAKLLNVVLDGFPNRLIERSPMRNFLRPVPMTKIGLIGLKDDRESILSVLHDLSVEQVEPLRKETLGVYGAERASDLQRTVSDQLIRFRGLRLALPPTPVQRRRHFENLAAVFETAQAFTADEEVGQLKREEDRLLTDRRSTQEAIALLERMTFYPQRLEYLHGRSILAFFGETDAGALAALRLAIPSGSEAHFVTDSTTESPRFLVVVRTDQADALNRLSQAQGVHLTAVPRLSGTIAEELPRLQAQARTMEDRLGAIHSRLAELSQQWYPTVAALEEALGIENRKLEVYTRMGANERTFALEGWVPKRDTARVEAALVRAAGDRFFLYSIPSTEEPPTLMENPAGVRRFEFFVRFYSLPQSTEFDPTLIFAIVFPIFFGIMLGDWGYGLVILLISIWMIRGFPSAHRLPRMGRTFVKRIMGPNAMQQLAYALLPGCAIAIGLGLYFDEFFGFHLLNYFFGTPVPFDPLRNVGPLLLFAGYFGLGMVTLGFTLGALKEHYHGHDRPALGKVGGIAFAWGIAFFGLAMIHQGSAAANPSGDPMIVVYYALLALGAILLVVGEGVQLGVMGLIEIISHILSYTRLVGILLASVVLALVINTIATMAVHTGFLPLVIGVLIAAVIIVFGQMFNVILGVFEPGIQGARLIFVEHFSKFYSGNGRPFRPFGSGRKYTLSTPETEPPARPGLGT